jgi:hypothetical protein
MKLIKWICVGVALSLAAFGTLFWRGYSAVHEPISHTLAQDSRNAGFEISASYAGLFDTSTLVLDLRRVDSASPADLMRGVFSAAAAMHKENERFDSVVLARLGDPVFIMSGSDFASLGEQFAGGQNPVFLIRTFPEKLKLPHGTPAFSGWTGGVLAVVAKQMQDANDAARQWAAGR